ncbi:hypothetical protein KUTeg_016057 [Tegillarca granosa]|uniref:Uncharacterized protein n=1 Tax=Tegillarca granosa TaxID=220873 RepID=A0ABQ9EJQ8_TEGGR|nr:hypothetical protein KUTeg_016057 [Tegillarca granosa]
MFSLKDDLIQNLKRSSRLLHYCATPLLFCPTWRQKVMEKYKATQKQVSVTSTCTEKSDIKTRSRHSSGTSNASMRTKRADSQDGKKKPSVTPTDSPVNEAKSRAGQEEPWHAELRHSFVNQYITYVQSLGFLQVQTRPASPKRGFVYINFSFPESKSSSL